MYLSGTFCLPGIRPFRWQVGKVDIAFSWPAESVTITLSPQCCLEAMASISMKIPGSQVTETLPHLAFLASSFPSSLVSPVGREEEHNQISPPQGRSPRPRTAAGLGQELSFLDSVPAAMTTVVWRFCLCAHQKEWRWPLLSLPLSGQHLAELHYI